MKEIKKWKWIYIALTVLVMALGMCLIIYPSISAKIMCILCGLVMIVAGAVRIVCYFKRGISVLWHRYEFPIGLLDCLVGLYVLSYPSNAMMIMPVVVGVVIIVDSVFKMQTSFEFREIGIRYWWSVLALAIVNTIVAFLLIKNPFEGSITLMVYIGISLIIDGIQSLVFVHHAAKLVKKPDEVEAEYIKIE